MKNVTRAQFIRGLGILGVGAAAGYLLLRRSAATLPRPWQRSDDHFLVFLTLRGGADVALGLDPQTSEASSSEFFLGYRADEVIRAGNLNLGPAAASLAPFHREICILNGVTAVRDFGHTANLQYLINGNLDAHSLSLIDEIAASVDRPEILTLADGSLLNQLHSRFSVEELIEKIFTISDASIQMSLADLLEPELGAPIKRFNAVAPEIRKFYNRLQRSEDPVNAVYNAVAASFSAGHSSGAVIDVCRLGQIHLDHHANFETLHRSEQTKAWEYVARLFSAFKSVPYMHRSLFDYCTFAVVSEFSRTPHLNSLGGKEHNPFTNSVLLAVKNIAGNQVIGASRFFESKIAESGSPVHTALPINFSTGEVAAQGASESGLVYPENVAATLRTAFGKMNTTHSNTLHLPISKAIRAAT